MPHKITDDCIACGSCEAECPEEAIHEGELFEIEMNVCSDCGACVEVCPIDCIVFYDE